MRLHIKDTIYQIGFTGPPKITPTEFLRTEAVHKAKVPKQFVVMLLAELGTSQDLTQPIEGCYLERNHDHYVIHKV